MVTVLGWVALGVQVVMFTDPDGNQAAVMLVREALLHSLGGALLGLAAVGGVIWHIAVASARDDAVLKEQ